MLTTAFCVALLDESTVAERRDLVEEFMALVEDQPRITAPNANDL